MNLSKSKYTQGVTCEKKLWLSCYNHSFATDTNRDAVLENGTKVGDIARGLFGDYTLVPFDENKENMILNTKTLLEGESKIICEASFSYNGNFCSVDILKKIDDEIEIYEVKSSTKIEPIYIDDISYQSFVLKKCGLNIKRAFLVYINNKYVKKGSLELDKLFKIEDVTSKIDFNKTEENVLKLKEVINKNSEPNIDLGEYCNKPYPCPFFKYCTRKLPSPNVFDVGWGVTFNKKLNMYKLRKFTYKDVLDYGGFNDKANEQMSFYLYNKNAKINKDNIIKTLDSLTYPLYFLDFESFQCAIPEIDGTTPYEQICFQYSLHYYLEKDGELFHKEYLSNDYYGNPMYGLCKRLCEDIPFDSCILVYNDSFEKTRLKEMANMFPEFSEHLLNIRDNIKDLLPIFKNHDYYVKEMEGSSSIKKVLPALFPNDKTLDYHNLEQVHKGDEASNAYLSLKDLEKKEEEKLRGNMLKYCGLDT